MVDMSPAAIARRLRRVAELNRDAAESPEWRAEQARRLAAARSAQASCVDMSPEAIARRLREASELLAVCQRLAQVGRRST